LPLGRNSWRSSDGSRLSGSSGSDTVDISRLRAVLRDVADLTAAVACLAAIVERATVWSGAVARDVTELAAGVALHGLSLAIASVVVRSTTLVAGRGARNTGISPAEAAAVAATRSTSATAGTAVRAVALPKLVHVLHVFRVPYAYGKVANLVAGIATTARSTIQAQCWAISLDMAKALAVVALFC
jgi:hypothetical protein